MKSVVISDNRDSLIGMRMAGLNGYLIQSPEEADEVIFREIKNPENGILFITEKAADMVRDKLIEFRKKSMFPLITVIPDRHGFTSHNEITKYITEAVGINS